MSSAFSPLAAVLGQDSKSAKKLLALDLSELVALGLLYTPWRERAMLGYLGFPLLPLIDTFETNSW